MFFPVAALLLIIFILLFLILTYRREVRHLLRQLEQLEAGSHMDLTSTVRNPDFLLLYQKLNHIFDDARAKELIYARSGYQLKQTISNLAHDIRTPLTSAAGYLQMLAECTQSETALRYEGIIEKRLDELKNMLEELFLYTKLTSDDFSLDCRSTAVFPILSECMLGLYYAFEEKQMKPEIQFEDETICVLAAPEVLGRIFRNLINNALLHGVNELCIVQRNTTIVFTNPVIDGSLETEKLFERFYKADKTRQRGSSGLGLSIVKELLERIGGTVHAVMDDENRLAVTITFLPAPLT